MSNTLGLGIAYSPTGFIMIGVVLKTDTEPYLAPMMFLDSLKDVKQFAKMLMEFHDAHRPSIPIAFEEAFKNVKEADNGG